ncbi:MAG: 50S ribosomal protein L21 [Firmicutes bacterium]|nr:50S ribosomal protein L21 [Bacillota bacterium]
MYAIIKNGGKQYKVVEGDTLQLEKIETEVGSLVKDCKVLLVADGESLSVGTPEVKDAEVVLKVVSHGKGEKVLVYKYKAKKNYRRKQGHRQPYTEVIVESIALNKESSDK